MAADKGLKKKDFEYVFKKGGKIKEDFLVLITAKNKLNKTRFGFIVSQKVSKKATVRNKVKRRLRAAVKLKTIKEGLDVIFIALPGLEKKDFREIKETVNILFKKAKYLTN